MAFVGRFADGEDESYEYTDLASLDDIPDEIVDNWGLREQMEEYEAENSDEEEDDDE